MLSSAKQHISRTIPNLSEPLVLGVSGGVDSMALLHLLWSLGYTHVYVCHVHHGMREDASQDLELVKEVTEVYNYTFHTKHVDISSFAKEAKQSVEQAGRSVRYAFFEQIRSEFNANWILLAHHSDDLLESQLLHLQRKTELFGLVGFRLKDQRRRVFRPLIECTKEEIYEYAQKKSLLWREDSTNADTAFSRNQIRLQLIPSLQQEFPSIHNTMKELSTVTQEILDTLYKTLQDHLGEQFEQQTQWNFDTLCTLGGEELSYALLYILRYRHPDYHYTQGMIQNALQHLRSLQSGQRIMMHKYCSFVRNFETLEYQEQIPIRTTSIETGVNTHSLDPVTIEGQIYTFSHNKAGALGRFPATYIEEGYSIRTRQPGDRITFSHKGQIQHKSLKKYLIEQKVPREKRDTILLLTGKATGEVFAILDPEVYYSYPCTDTDTLIYIHSS